MKAHQIAVLALLSLALGIVIGGALALGGGSWIGRAWRGLGSIFGGPAASPSVEVEIAPATTTEGRTIPWYGAR